MIVVVQCGVVGYPVNGEKDYSISLISIVDDDRSVREATTSLLNSSGFRTEGFGSAEEFLNSPFLEETRCLVLDVQMPGMDGLQLQRRLAADGRRIPIIFITAHGDQKMRSEVIRAGAVALLSKPFSEDALLQPIHSVLQNPGGK